LDAPLSLAFGPISKLLPMTDTVRWSAPLSATRSDPCRLTVLPPFDIEIDAATILPPTANAMSPLQPMVTAPVASTLTPGSSRLSPPEPSSQLVSCFLTGD
jgi:hypothetical protein